MSQSDAESMEGEVIELDGAVVDHVKDRLSQIESDDRIELPPANVETNAPLALVQTDLDAKRRELQWFVELLESHRVSENGGVQ